MDIRYVIPSYRRINTLKEKTFALLERHNIPTEQIFIFTSPDELSSYQVAFPKCNVVCGELGLKNQRNYITNYFLQGDPLVSFDDDIESLHILKDNKLIELEDLKEFVKECFEGLKQFNLSMWGIYPIKNAFFMKQTRTTDLKFCIGHMFGVFNCKDIQLTLDLKDDYERVLRFYKRDGGVLRINYVCAKTKMYASGGINLKKKQRLKENMESAKRLIDLFPGLVRANKKREGEIILSLPRGDVAPRIDRGSTKTFRQSSRRTKEMENSSNND